MNDFKNSIRSFRARRSAQAEGRRVLCMCCSSCMSLNSVQSFVIDNCNGPPIENGLNNVRLHPLSCTFTFTPLTTLFLHTQKLTAGERIFFIVQSGVEELKIKKGERKEVCERLDKSVNEEKENRKSLILKYSEALNQHQKMKNVFQRGYKEVKGIYILGDSGFKA